jgi:hypothetical protein
MPRACPASIAGKLHGCPIVNSEAQPESPDRSIWMTAPPLHPASPARRLQDALARSPAGAALLERYAASQRAAAAIEPECQRIVPDLSPTRSGVCELRGSTLRVNARSPAQIAKLRQAAPRLLSRLQQQGLDVIEIKFGVQPRPLSSSVWSQGPDSPGGPSQTPPAAARLSSEIHHATEFASKLVLTLNDSPLRDAALRLLASLTHGVARMRESGQPCHQENGKKEQA